MTWTDMAIDDQTNESDPKNKTKTEPNGSDYSEKIAKNRKKSQKRGTGYDRTH